MKPEEAMDEIEIWDEELQENIILRFKHAKKICYNGIQIEEVREGNGWKTVREAKITKSPDDYAPAPREKATKRWEEAETEYVKPFWQFW